MSRRGHAIRLSFYYLCLFWIVGIYVPFLPVWLDGRGLSPEQIGLVLAGALWAKIPFGLGLTGLADHSGDRRRLLIAIALCVAVGLLVFEFLSGFWALFLGWLVVGALLTTAIPLADSLSLLSAARTGIDYGRVRLWGSISFILAATAGGWYLHGRDGEAVLTLLIAGAAALIVASVILPGLRVAARQRRRPAVLELIRSPSFCLFVATAALLQASHAALYAFASLHWRNAGLGEGVIGLLWAEGVIAEILLFSVAGALIRRLGVTRLLLLAATAGMIRWTTLGLTVSVFWLALAQLLHALTFSATLVAAVSYIQQSVPEDQSASAQGLYDALAMGLFFGIAMAAAGRVYSATPEAAFFLMAALSAAGGVGALLLHRKGASS